MYPLQSPIPIPQHQIPMRGALRRKVLRQRLPLAARPQHVKDRVDNLADVHRALATAALGWRNKRCNQRPFLVCQIAVVAQSDPARCQSVLWFPHWRLSPCESLRQQGITTDSPDSTTRWIGSERSSPLWKQAAAHPAVAPLDFVLTTAKKTPR